jgi:ribosomal protein S18 acetylase RimI-like enzyme
MCIGADTLITIRKLLRDDKDPIRHILEETNVFTSDEITIAIELIDVFLDDPKQKDYYLYTSITEQNEVVGYVCVGPTPLTEGTFDLYWIVVKPSVHGKGFGRQLLQMAEEFVKEHNGRLLIAETSSQPKYESTRMFYSKNSYTEISRIKDYYRPSDDLIIYGKYLSQSGGL